MNLYGVCEVGSRWVICNVTPCALIILSYIFYPRSAVWLATSQQT
jgi:hypothetical protein